MLIFYIFKGEKMGKHFTEEQEKEIYNTFFQLGKKDAIELMYKYGAKAKDKYVKARLRRILKHYNCNMNKKPRKPGTGRSRKVKEQDINWDIFTREDLIEIAKRYREITKDKFKTEKVQEASHISIVSYKLAILLSLCRQTISKHKRNNFAPRIKSRKIKYQDLIIDSFKQNRSKYGRQKLKYFILKHYKIDINERTLGRYMNALGLFCNVRKRKKLKEVKNTSVIKENIVNRDYNDVYNRNIYATDVTYLPATKDAINNNVYLSVVIKHKTKEIISFSLSKFNDSKLIYKTFENVDFEKSFILHSDHCSTYTSDDFSRFIQNKGGIISLSKVGNSLDNRVVEYWFSNLKTELIRDLNIKAMTLSELEKVISNYVHWYNKFRIQSCLNWKTPYEYSMGLSNLINC
ncbi:IS3 family transposase [Mycoplasmopsis gallopavonis]|nr:IS3 family transposase [Mycoplasmopsis gallopavonis]